MSFGSLMRDKVTLIKKDGNCFDNIRAFVQSDKIFTDDPTNLIEDGDVFERTLPNGIVERYTILDAGFMQGTVGIKPHYQSVVRKQTKIDLPTQPGQIVYNLTGPNTRVNIQSVDSSANLVEVEPTELFGRIREAIGQSVQDGELLRKLQEKVTELQKAQGTPGFVVRYKEFMALAANHMTLLAPFIPALFQMMR
ncbi:MAG: hypothetical protein Q7T57_05180 [Dehalococcoidales bacterium]|nr:hypothetical protein [Dehalococcoidales bacterium]